LQWKVEREIKLSLLFLFVLFGIYSTCEAMAPTLLEHLKPVLDAEWQKIDPTIKSQPKDLRGIFWQYVISPPFPSMWPPDSNSSLWYYLYAVGHDIRGRLADGIHVSAPWGRVELDIRGKTPLKFKPLASKLKAIRIQGVRPINKDEATIYERRESAETYLGTLTTLPDENEGGVLDLKKYYCTWSNHNGVMVEGIRPHHMQFFQWLGCE
jgi:hypothetical protein